MERSSLCLWVGVRVEDEDERNELDIIYNQYVLDKEMREGIVEDALNYIETKNTDLSDIDYLPDTDLSEQISVIFDSLMWLSIEDEEVFGCKIRGCSFELENKKSSLTMSCEDNFINVLKLFQLTIESLLANYGIYYPVVYGFTLVINIPENIDNFNQVTSQ